MPWFADTHTVATSVGVLLAPPPGTPPSALAGDAPLPGRNYVLAVDQATLLPVLGSPRGPGAASRAPLLLYLSANVSLARPVTKAAGPLPVNRHLLLVGKATGLVSLDLGMEAGSLALGPAGALTAARLALENLAPGDARAAATAGPYDVRMSYNLWAVAFSRCAATQRRRSSARPAAAPRRAGAPPRRRRRAASLPAPRCTQGRRGAAAAPGAAQRDARRVGARGGAVPLARDALPRAPRGL